MFIIIIINIYGLICFRVFQFSKNFEKLFLSSSYSLKVPLRIPDVSVNGQERRRSGKYFFPQLCYQY